MKFDFNMPVNLISGKDCVSANADKLIFGKSCIIVTGKNSAIASGAFFDVISVLDSKGVAWTLFDKIRENPLLSTCYEGGKLAHFCGADFVIGIGGGSPLDAAKAIAAFAANPEIEPDAIFEGGLKPSLPIVAIPTTAGTGSEANPYSILSLDGKDKKRTFNSPESYPKVAFLDAKYTYSLGLDYTISCALDAFCHCVESYMSPKSTAHSRMYAIYGAKLIWGQLKRGGIPDEAGREALMNASCAGGIAINTTGTGFPHPLGYNLTMLRGIPHGRACGAFMREYIECCLRSDEGKMLTKKLAEELNCELEDIMSLIPRLADVKLTLTEEEIDDFVEKVRSAGNFKNCCTVIDEPEMKEIYRRLFKH